MGQLGDLLEVLHGPDDRYRTVRATVRRGSDRELLGKVQREQGEAIGRRRPAEEAGPAPPKSVEITSSIWLSRPGRARIERRRVVDGLEETTLIVINGGRRWECDPDGHVETSMEGRRGRGWAEDDKTEIDADRHFHPGQIREFFQHLILESTGTVRAAGRECLRIRGLLRPGTGLWHHWLPRAASEYEFHADLERGVLLGILGRCGDKPLEWCEVLEVAYDESLDPELFTYEPAPGEQVGPETPVVEHLSLAGAVSRMSFTVLVPTRLPDAEHARVDFMYHPPRRNEMWPHLALMFRSTDHFDRLWVSESERPDPALDRYEWEHLGPGESGPSGLRLSDPGVDSDTRLLAFEQEGTHVTIRSDLDRDRLIDLARSFVAASGSTLA